MNHRQRTVAELQAECDEFNARAPIGTRVAVRVDNADYYRKTTEMQVNDKGEVLTNVRERAQVLSGHTPVVWLRGIAGCYDLSRVRVVAEGE